MNEDYCNHGMHRNAFHCAACADEYMGSCPRCRHPWNRHGLVPRGTDWPPCCTVNVGQGDPCGCSDVASSPEQPKDGE